MLASAANGKDARTRLAIIAHWASEQDARLAARRRTLRLDSARLVNEAMAESDRGARELPAASAA